MNSTIAIVAGNGLSISRRIAARSSMDPSAPFSWRVRVPGEDKPLVDSLPDLEAWLLSANAIAGATDYEKICALTASLPKVAGPRDLTEHFQSVLLDLRHYLVLAYSEFQLDLDRRSMERWAWLRWFEQHRKDLVAALSWNYDLVLERLLLRARGPFHYPGAGGWPEWDGRPFPRPGIPVCKPHGSVNFAIDGLSVRSAEHAGGPTTRFRYPRPLDLMSFDGPTTTLKDHELLRVREVADIVLPGERNALGPYLEWMRKSIGRFKHHAPRAQRLVIVGFSMAPCDVPEFLEALSWCSKFQEVVVVDPKPNPHLLDLVAPLAKTLTLRHNEP